MNSSQWKNVKLDEVININPSRPLPKEHKAKKVPMDALNVDDRHINYYESTSFTGSGTRFKNGDTILARITPCLENGKTAYIDFLKKDEVAFGSTEYIVLSSKDNISNSLFIYYLAKYKPFRDYLISHMEGTSGRQRVPASSAASFEIQFPPLREQDKIASILSSIDNYRANNKKIIENLENHLNTLFRGKFIDYEFNNNEKPENWVESKIEQIISNKSERIGSDIDEVNILSAVKTGDLVKSDEYFTKQVYSKDTSKYKRVDKYDFAYNPARINIGSIGMNESDETGAVSPVYVVFAPKEHYQWFIKMFLIQERTKKIIAQLCSGSVRQVIDFKTFSTIELTIPPEEDIIKFNETFMKYKNLIDLLKAENETLVEIRDNLLPKLISGEIRVS